MTHPGLLRLSLLLFLFLSSVLNTSAATQQDNEPDIYQQLEIFSSVLANLEQSYVTEINSKEAIESAISGLLSSLDPHSSYLLPDEFKNFQQETFGSFSGIGIEVTTENNELTVIAPIDDTPGARAGIRARDKIVEINGFKTSEIGPHKAIQKLRGPQGTKVTIKIKRKSRNKLVELTITRENIPTKSVYFVTLEPGFIYTRITSFQGNTSYDYTKMLDEAKKTDKVKGLILDLRNNPGGLFNQAISISDLFLKSGEIVSTKGRNPSQNQSFKAHDVGEKNDFPIAILINGGTASASEIVAGALQAHNRAMVVGTQSFGKGSVQSILPLPNGAGLRMTTAHYYTPNDVSIQAVGITPDIEVVYQEPASTQASRPLKEADLSNHLKNPDKKNSAKQAETAPEIKDMLATDNQLKTALTLLKGISTYAGRSENKQL